MSKYSGRKVTVVPDYFKDLNSLSNNDLYGNCLLASNVHPYIHGMNIRFDSISNPYKCVNGYFKVDLIIKKVVIFRMFFKDEATMDNVLSLLNPTDKVDEVNESSQDVEKYYVQFIDLNEIQVYELATQTLVATFYREDLAREFLQQS